MSSKVKQNGGGKGNGSVKTTQLKEDFGAGGGGHESRKSSVPDLNGNHLGPGGRVKYRRTRSVGRAEEITKEENKQRRQQPDKP